MKNTCANCGEVFELPLNNPGYGNLCRTCSEEADRTKRLEFQIRGNEDDIRDAEVDKLRAELDNDADWIIEVKNTLDPLYLEKKKLEREL